VDSHTLAKGGERIPQTDVRKRKGEIGASKTVLEARRKGEETEATGHRIENRIIPKDRRKIIRTVVGELVALGA